MVDIPIRFGNCSCPLAGFVDFFEQNRGWVCWRDYAIHLGKYLEEEDVEAVLNHEYIHVVIGKLESKDISKRFDLLFDGDSTDIGEDGI